MHEREAYRAVFSFGGTVDNLNASQVSGLEGAIRNARAFAAEVVALLRQTQPREAVA
jgi:chromosome partitioning protein